MKSIDYYRMIHGSIGAENYRDTVIRQVKYRTGRDFDQTIDAQPVTINGLPQNLLITHTKTKTQKNIHSRPDEDFNLGDIVHWMDYDWLVKEVDPDNRINMSGKMEQCNVVLRWINGNGDTVQYSGVCEDATKYSKGVDTRGEKVRVGEFQIKIKLPLDHETVLLSRDKRFLIDAGRYVDVMAAAGVHPDSFMIVRRNIITGTYHDVGYVEITLLEDEYAADRDNVDAMIANYTLLSPRYEIHIDNISSPVYVETGKSIPLLYRVVKNGTVIPSPYLQYNSDNPDIVTVTGDGIISAHKPGSGKITVSGYGETEEVDVIVVGNTAPHEYNIVLTPKDNRSAVVYGTGTEVLVQVYKSSVIDDSIPFGFELIQDSEQAMVTSVQDHTISLSVSSNKKRIGSVFTLRVWIDVLGVRTERAIEFTIKGLI